MFVNSGNILLRKVRGALEACHATGSPLAGTPAVLRHPSPLMALGAFLSVIALPLLALALVVALFVLPSPLHAATLAGVALANGVVAAPERVSNELAEKRERFGVKQRELGEVFQLAKDGNTYDFSRKSVLEKLGAVDAADAVAKVKQRNVELDALGADLQHAELKHVEQSMATREAARNEPLGGAGIVHAVPGSEGVKSFGQLFAESKAYLEGFRKNLQIGIPTVVEVGIKTLFQTSAGLAPESVRSGLMVEAVTRPIQLLDLIPVRPIGQAVDKYMEETTRTHAAAEKAEGVTYAESTFAWTEKTSPVQKITDSVPVTDEQLEDAPQVSSILDSRLRFGLNQRLDLQVLNGNGTAPNLRGLLQVAGIQTQAKGADPVFDAVFKALTLVRFTGRAQPSALVFHPTDWQNIRLTRDSTGRYIMGDPAAPGPMTLFGLPVSLQDAVAAGTGLTGDFANFCYIGERRGVEVQIGYTGTQFVEGKKTLRADLRACFTVTRPAAFATITGL